MLSQAHKSDRRWPETARSIIRQTSGENGMEWNSTQWKGMEWNGKFQNCTCTSNKLHRRRLPELALKHDQFVPRFRFHFNALKPNDDPFKRLLGFKKCIKLAVQDVIRKYSCTARPCTAASHLEAAVGMPRGLA